MHRVSRVLGIVLMLILVPGSGPGEEKSAVTPAGQDPAVKANGHGAKPASDELKNFKPEFFPNRIEARLYLRNHRVTHQLPAAGPSGVNPQRFFLEMSRRWDIGSTVTVSFRGGDKELHDKIVTAASEWTKYANLKLDFGLSGGKYRTWSPSDTKFASQIRVSFDDPDGGYWSVIGKDSADPHIMKPGEASLNLQDFHIQLPSTYAALTMHEFGHAIGFLHEHQSPVSGCDAEFRWYDDASGPGLYTLLGQQEPPWSPAMVNFNLKQMPTSSAYEVGPYDRLSIMHYHFPAEFFLNGASSPCYVPQNLVLSEGDKAGAKKAYPHGVAEIAAVRGIHVRNLEAILQSKHLGETLKARFQAHLKSLKNQ